MNICNVSCHPEATYNMSLEHVTLSSVWKRLGEGNTDQLAFDQTRSVPSGKGHETGRRLTCIKIQLTTVFAWLFLNHGEYFVH